MIGKSDSVAIGWCDNGTTDGKFTEGLATAIIAGPNNGMHINTSVRVQGNQIGRQRQVLFDHWADKLKTDWLLWVDSDIVLNLEAMQKLWQAADKINRPVVSGVYFISKENEGTLMRPFPVLFNDVSEYQIQYVHPLPDNQVIPVDNAGFGFVAMKSGIFEKIQRPWFSHEYVKVGETKDGKDIVDAVGEDISWCVKAYRAGIDLYFYPDVLVTHMKKQPITWDHIKHLSNQKNK